MRPARQISAEIVRVGCLRGGAIRPLEEWSPISGNGVDKTRLTGPLAFLFGRFFSLVRWSRAK